MKRPFLVRLSLLFGCYLLLLCSSCNNKGEHPKAMTPADSLAAEALEQKMFAVQYQDPDSALYYAGLQHAILRRYNGLEEDMDYYERGLVYSFMAGKIQEALYFYDSAELCLRKAPQNPALQFKEAYIRGVYYMGVDKVDKQDSAIAAFLQALQIFPEDAEAVSSIDVYGYLAQLYLAQKNYPSAIRYYRSILNYAMSRPHRGMQEIGFMLDAYTYYSKGSRKDQEEAAQILFDAYREMLAINDSSLYVPLFYNLAEYYLSKGDADSAMYYAERSIMSKGRGPEIIQQTQTAYNMIVTHLLDHGRYDEAIATFTKQQKATDTAAYIMDDKMVYLRNAHRISMHKGQTLAAWHILAQQLALSEQMNVRDKNEQLLLHEREIKRLAAEKVIARKDKELLRQRGLSILGLVVSFFLVILLLVIYLYVQKKRKLEIERLAYVQKQQELEFQQMLLDERNRIAQEMHDDLGSTLTSTFMAVELLKVDKQEPTHMDMLERSTQRLSEQINEVIWNLNLRNDTLASLSAYMIRFARRFMQDAGLGFRYHEALGEEGRTIELSGARRRMVYLSVKEILNNIVKHAGAQNVYLDIRCDHGHLYLQLADDGRGFDGDVSASLQEAGRGNGLFNIRQRIAAAGGKVLWRRAKEGKGTEVCIDIVLESQKKYS